MTMRNNRAGTTSPRGKGRPRTFDREAALTRALEVFWRQGYEPASVAELCEAMGINPPSLYAAFGNKAHLFLEAVKHYETVYWEPTWARMAADPDLHHAIETFFKDAARILTSPEAPCGCLVVLAAVNVSEASQDVLEALRTLRQEGKEAFLARLKRAVKDGALPRGTDVKALACALKTLLEGMSLQARDGMPRSDLEGIAKAAVSMLSPRPAATRRA